MVAQPYLGWTPMTPAQQEPMMHIDRLHGRLRAPRPIRISQLKDNIGQGEDSVDKDNYLSDLSRFYKDFQSDLNFHQHEPSDSLHAMTLGGNDEGLNQLELAAHHLAMGGYSRSPITRPRFKVDPKPQLSQQKLVSFAESMLEDSKLDGRFSPKQFIQARKRQPTLDQDTEQQQPERPHQQAEESHSSHDPMHRQTSSKVPSTEASETLRQKDSAALITRTRLGPQMHGQLDLSGGPPTKIQLSLDTTPLVGSAKLRLPNPFSNSGMTGSFVSPDMAHDAGLRAPIVAANLPANNLPVRFREVSIYRPFGYESHHAIAYQASPTVAALFPGLAQSTRPSVLRHMTPFRAIQTQRGLINPIMPAFQVIDNAARNNQAPPPAAGLDQFQQTSSMSQAIPIDGFSRIRPGFGGGPLLKRQSHRIKTLSNKWPSLATSHLGVDAHLMQSKMNIRRSIEEDRSLMVEGNHVSARPTAIRSRLTHSRGAIRH